MIMCMMEGKRTEPTEFDETIERIRIAIYGTRSSYKHAFNRIKHRCLSREVINDRTIYCKKRHVHIAFRDNCTYDNCLLIHGKR